MRINTTERLELETELGRISAAIERYRLSLETSQPMRPSELLHNLIGKNLNEIHLTDAISIVTEGIVYGWFRMRNLEPPNTLNEAARITLARMQEV
jgi:hypothetical protein